MDTSVSRTYFVASNREFFYAKSETLINKLNTHSARLLSRYEAAASTLRLMELRERPVAPTFDVIHLREINRRLLQDVYPWAGRFKTGEVARWNSPIPGTSDLYGKEIEKMLQTMHNNIMETSGSKERFVHAIGKELTVFDMWSPFVKGNVRTSHIYLSQLAQAAGYELDFSRVPRREWDKAQQRAFVDQENSVNKIALRSLIRETTRPLMAGAFAESIRNDDRADAEARFPQLRTVFQALDNARDQLTQTARADDVERLYRSVVMRTQRALDAGVSSQESWERMLRQIAPQERGMER